MTREQFIASSAQVADELEPLRANLKRSGMRNEVIAELIDSEFDRRIAAKPEMADAFPSESRETSGRIDAKRSGTRLLK